jgi:hypothetical protein
MTSRNCCSLPSSFLATPYLSWFGDRAVTSEHGERHGGVVPQVEPLFLPPILRSGHGYVKIRVDARPSLDMDNAPPETIFSTPGPYENQTRKTWFHRSKLVPIPMKASDRVAKVTMCKTPEGVRFCSSRP